MAIPPPRVINEKEHYNAKPPIFDGERFDYWKDKIKSFFLGYDVDLWDMVVDGYEYLIDASGNINERKRMNDPQKKDYKNHHKTRTIILNVISYTEYEKLTNRDFAKSIFDSLKMIHVGNAQVKETKALALIQKYEAFKMEDDETIEDMFSRFQTLDAGLMILNKGDSTLYHQQRCYLLRVQISSPLQEKVPQALEGEAKKKKFFKGSKKGFMATWEDSDSSEDDSEEEQAKMVLIANIRGFDEKIQPKAESKSDSHVEEVFLDIYRSDLTYSLFEILEKHQELQIKFKELKKVHEFVYEEHNKLKKEFSILKKENFFLKDENSTLKSMSSKLEKEIPPWLVT
ncbi:uncharacterized protein LOC131651291 [Vicia villosa]|uniref:uncharacterized protein LOC131651291 n=1 Tax=Vicia villosa TaxID=3911 RepID=UPI00273C4082|nr:uncharacterized protein LOC131651291 [Vicia villosa]